MMKIAIIGTVGVPARYGGFETLADNLAQYHARTDQDSALSIWCSSAGEPGRATSYENAELRFVRLRANGAQSIAYDLVCLVQALWSRHDCVLMLGVSGAIGLPIARMVSRAKIITNVDGIEWRRAKWGRLTRAFLRFSEWLAVKFSHEVVADNQAIAEHISRSYGRESRVIAYGGDHSTDVASISRGVAALPDRFVLGLCRIEPENNVEMILEAWCGASSSLVFVGNWSENEYGRRLRRRYSEEANILLLDPIYEPGELHFVRSSAHAYVHGHSAGGTNPALVEMMHFGIPVLAFDCVFNRYTTEGEALLFASSEQLRDLVANCEVLFGGNGGERMRAIALRRYTWDAIGAQYFGLFQ